MPVRKMKLWKCSAKYKCGTKNRSRLRNRAQVISANPGTMTLAAAHLQGYERAWKQRYDKLESLLSTKGE